MKLLQFFAVVALLGVVVLAIVWHYRRAASLLRQWAERNGYRLVSSEYRLFVRGPFFWTTSKGQVVYRVTVQDAQGNTRSGWVRCGGWFLGLFSDHVEARWDD
jgi:hypothetical protein